MSMVIGFEEQAPAAVTFRGERVNQKNIWAFLAVAVVVAVGALGLLFYERLQLQEARTRVVVGELQPIAMLLHENQAISRRVGATGYRSTRT
jgi:hypothetical protein